MGLYAAVDRLEAMVSLLKTSPQQWVQVLPTYCVQDVIVDLEKILEDLEEETAFLSLEKLG